MSDVFRWLTPFDSINNFTCSEYLDCPLKPNVVLCTYSGGHTYPPMIEEATFLFLDQVDHFLKNNSEFPFYIKLLALLFTSFLKITSINVFVFT